MTDKRYSMYMPFHAAVGGGGETQIERVEINDHDLRLLTKELQIMSSQRTLAFFGQCKPVLASVNLIIDENIKEDSVTKQNSIYVAIKDEWVAIFAIIDEQFFKKRVIDKESIVITLFRYLQDFSATVVLCVDDDMVANFVAGTTNPFCSAAHSARMYKLEAHKHVELNTQQLETHSKLLENDLDFKLDMLVLNDNGSRFFLHQKLDTMIDEELAIQTRRCNSLVEALVKRYEAKPAEVETMVREYKFELSSEHLHSVIGAHKKYSHEISDYRKSFSSYAADHVYKGIAEEIQTFSSSESKVSRAIKSIISTSDKTNNNPQKASAAVEILAYFIIDAFLAKCNIVSTESQYSDLYDTCSGKINAMFMQSLPSINATKVQQTVNRLFTREKFSKMLQQTRLQSMVQNMVTSVNTILTSSRLSKKRLTLRLNMCAINTQQSADGTCTGLIIAPHLSKITIQPEQLLSYFPTNTRNSSSNVDESLLRIKVKATFPLKSGQTFLLLFEDDKTALVLVAISSVGSHTLVTKWKINDSYLILPFNLPSFDVQSLRFVLITTDRHPRYLLFEIDESLKYKALKEGYINGEIKGLIVSAASFPVREKVILLTNESIIYAIKLSELCSGDVEAQIIIMPTYKPRKSAGKQSAQVSTKPYCEVHSLQSESYLVLCNSEHVDVFNWNFTPQLSLKKLAGSAVKVFSDNKNVYLVAFNQSKITSHAFLELGADVILQHQKEMSVEQVNGNPIVDVTYASYLKYGPNSSFIGAPAQNNFIVALPNDNGNFSKNLSAYLRTFRTRSLTIITETTLNVKQKCISQPANRHLPAIMSSRTPVHICTVEANNLLPLVDGNRHRVATEQATSIAEAAEYITFAHLERVIGEFCSDRSVRVVSIIGRQSSGKSYLLNQLFGTRFSVAATRCTDGIWMSYARIVVNNDESESPEEQSFLVLDCEGLFSINRNEQEEVKLLMVLAAISDVTILNQDLNFNRHINKLFKNLNNAVGKVSGSHYFHGKLMVTVRDVKSTESAITAQEFERNIKTLNGRGEHKFLLRLFGGKMIFQCLNHFENANFLVELEKTRENLVKSESDFVMNKSKNSVSEGLALLESLKVVLVQVYKDDEQSADEHLKQINQINIDNSVTAAWGEIGKVGSKAAIKFYVSLKTGKLVSADSLNPEEQVFEMAQNYVRFEHVATENDSNFEKIKTSLEEHFFRLTADRHAKQGYNQRWTAFNAFLEEFVRHRADLLEQYAQDQLQKLGRFMKSEEMRNVMIGLKEKIRSFTDNCGICLDQCAHCYLKCLNRKGHKESLEPQKQQIQNLLKALNLEFPDLMSIKMDDLTQKLHQTKARLEEKQQKFSQVEAELMLVEERYEEAKLSEQLSQKSIEVDSDISEKQKLLLVKNSQMDQAGSPKDSLLVFLLSSVNNLQQVGNECTTLRNAIQQLNDSQPGQVGGSVQVNSLLNPSSTTGIQENVHIASSVIVKGTSTAALHDSVNNLLATLACDWSKEISNELAVKKLSVLCADLPALAQHVRQMVAEAENILDTLSQQQKGLDDEANQNQALLVQVTALEESCSDLMSEVSCAKENIRQQTKRKAALEAELEKVLRLLESKQTELSQSKANLSAFQSLPDLERYCQKLRIEVDNLTALLKSAESKQALLLSSEEEARKVAEMMIEYITRYNTEQQPLDLSSQKHANSSEVMTDFEYDEKDEREIRAGLKKQILWDSQNYYLQFSRLLAQLKKIEEERQKCSEELEKVERRQQSFQNSLKESDDEKSICFFHERLKEIQNQMILLESQIEKIETKKSRIVNSDFFQQCQHQQQLCNKLHAEYAAQMNDKNLLSCLLKVVELRLAINELTLKLNAETRDKTNSDISADAKQSVDKQDSVSDFESIEADIKKDQELLEQKTKVLHEMLWNAGYHEKVTNARKKLSQLNQRLASNEPLLVEGRNSQNTLQTLTYECDNLLTQKTQLLAELHETVSSIDKLQSQYQNFSSMLQGNQKKYREMSESLQHKRNNNAFTAMKLNHASKKAQLNYEFGKQIDVALTGLGNAANRRKEYEDDLSKTEQLKQEIALLRKTQTYVQEQKSALECKQMESSSSLLLKSAELKDIYKNRREELNEARANYDYESKYIKLIHDQRTLKKNINCVCYFTNHACDQQCSICPHDARQSCKHKAGHDDAELLRRGLAGPKEHCCNKSKHDCPGKCHLCKSPCVYPLDHTNPAHHLCSSSHQCERHCQYCTNRCRLNLAEKHSTHVCTEDKCPKRCILCGIPCSGKHNHDDTAPLIDVDLCFDKNVPTPLKDIVIQDKRDGKMKVKLHLCDKEHWCPKSCDKAGVCEIHYVSETRDWTQAGSSQEYEYIRPERKSRRCALRIQAGKAWHGEVHNCGKQHTCSNACPECGSFCKENIGHAGPHKTVVHRNMEHCYCVTKSMFEKVTVQDASGKKARVYQAGNALTPEICTQHCNRRGRAHYHLRPCPGGLNCGQIKYTMGVKHSEERYYPHVDMAYDKYLCTAFWSSSNWLPPSDDLSIQLCNFACPHKDHESELGTYNFCSGGAWHTQSFLAKDHTFYCGHDFSRPVFNGLDLCFCIDTTGSMDKFIKESAESIKKIMRGILPQLAAYRKDVSCLRFAVVGYKDHCDHDVETHVDFCSDKMAISFLENLCAEGGGDGPEAVLDGLNAASKLSWRADCEKLLIHVCDAPPHGKQFSSMPDDHPDGCPCMLDEGDVLNQLKRKSIKYYVIPLTAVVNDMIDIFSEHITVVRKDLGDDVDLSNLISETVGLAIEDCELTATFSELVV